MNLKLLIAFLPKILVTSFPFFAVKACIPEDLEEISEQSIQQESKKQAWKHQVCLLRSLCPPSVFSILLKLDFYKNMQKCNVLL